MTGRAGQLRRDQQLQIGRMVVQMRRADIPWKVIEHSMGRSRRRLMQLGEIAVPGSFTDTADEDAQNSRQDAQRVDCEAAAPA